MSSRGRCAGRLGRSVRDLDAGVLTFSDGSVASTRDIGLEVFEAELQLVVVKPLGAPAKLAALQLLNDEAETFDLRLCFSEAGAFGRQRAHHSLQRLHIVRQGSKIDVHKPEVYADSRASSPINMPVSQSAAVIIPPRPVAIAARVRANRRRQSASTTAPRSASASHPGRRSTASRGERMHQRTSGESQWGLISLPPEQLAACGK